MQDEETPSAVRELARTAWEPALGTVHTVFEAGAEEQGGSEEGEETTMRTWTEHNLNDRVRVKLTPFGVDLLKAYWRTGTPEYVAKAIQSRVLEEQLWRVMEMFGPHLRMGSVRDPIEMPFEIEVER